MDLLKTIDLDQIRRMKDAEFQKIDHLISTRLKEFQDYIDNRFASLENKLDLLISKKVTRRKVVLNNAKQNEDEAQEEDNTMVPSKFGMENYDYINLTSIIKSSNDMIAIHQNIIFELYSSPKCKQNHIIKLNNDMIDILKVVDGTKIWKSYDKHIVIEKIIKRANDVMQHYLIGTDEEEEKLFQQDIGKKKYDQLVEFTDKIDNIEDNDDLRKKLISVTEKTLHKMSK